MKKSATEGFTKAGKPGLTWLTGSYAPGDNATSLLLESLRTR